MLHEGLTHEQSDFWNALGDYSYIAEMCEQIQEPYELAHAIGAELVKVPDSDKIVNRCVHIVMDRGLSAQQVTCIIREWFFTYGLVPKNANDSGFRRFHLTHGNTVIGATDKISNNYDEDFLNLYKKEEQCTQN